MMEFPPNTPQKKKEKKSNSKTHTGKTNSTCSLARTLRKKDRSYNLLVLTGILRLVSKASYQLEKLKIQTVPSLIRP